MKTGYKYVLAFFLACAAAVSFLCSAYIGLSSFADENAADAFFAPVIVNIETDKSLMNDYRVITEPGGKVYIPAADPAENDLRNAVVYAEIRGEFIQKLLVKYTGGQAGPGVNSIDNITVFIGNKTFYFQKSEIAAWEQTETEDGVLFQLPVTPYARSVMNMAVLPLYSFFQSRQNSRIVERIAPLVKPWINWYGDLNFALREIIAFLRDPFSFFTASCFILLCVFTLWTELARGAGYVISRHGRKTETAALLLLLVFAFLLRFDGFARHSLWIDELSSITRANPRLPLLNAFKDPGNPPLFYLLLRLWHELFGWTEAAGRMLSVFIGVAGIITFYWFVKMAFGRKYAFLAAFLLTINPSHIGFSHEIRAYILQITLAPLAAGLFFALLEKGGVKRYALYILAGSALVNTHYYGVLLIAFNFLYYAAADKKSLFSKKTFCFLAANFAIALSLLPFFIITAFQRALMNPGFNTWITRAGVISFIRFIMLLSVCFIFPKMKKLLKDMPARPYNPLDYAVYAASFIYIAAFIISQKRPILTWRYLSICLPFVFSILPAIFKINGGALNAAIRFVILAGLVRFSCDFRMFEGGSSDVYKEAQSYISADAGAHSLRAAELVLYLDIKAMSQYYSLKEIDKYSSGADYDVVYVNPVHLGETGMIRLLDRAGLDRENILKIKVANGRFILKKYLGQTAH